MRYRVGDKQVPCGTLPRMGLVLEKKFSVLTFNLFERYLRLNYFCASGYLKEVICVVDRDTIPCRMLFLRQGIWR